MGSVGAPATVVVEAGCCRRHQSTRGAPTVSVPSCSSCRPSLVAVEIAVGPGRAAVDRGAVEVAVAALVGGRDGRGHVLAVVVAGVTGVEGRGDPDERSRVRRRVDAGRPVAELGDERCALGAPRCSRRRRRGRRPDRSARPARPSASAGDCRLHQPDAQLVLVDGELPCWSAWNPLAEPSRSQ